MANLRSIRKRIASVKNTRQITKAMKLVSGAKLKRATDAVVSARPYSRKLKEILENVLARTEQVSHPLFQARDEVRHIRIILFGSDRGLCGSFNSSLQRRVEHLLKELPGVEIDFITIGRKPRDYARRRGWTVVKEFGGVAPARYSTLSRELVVELLAEYEAARIDKVLLVFNQFRTALSQDVIVESLLPLTPPKAEEVSGSMVDFIYEPSRSSILDALLPQIVTARTLQAFLESNASEHGARMTSMDNATRNATEMIDRLTLEYNRARQAAITKELVEIVSGAEAL